jgi:hypothetical protein
MFNDGTDEARHTNMLHIQVTERKEIIRKRVRYRNISGFIAKDPEWEPSRFRIIVKVLTNQVMYLKMDNMVLLPDFLRHMHDII